MTQTRHIYRFWGTVDATQALHHNTAKPVIHDAMLAKFGVAPYRVKMLAKKLTRFHTHRHFIAYFDAVGGERVSEVLGTSSLAHEENGIMRVTFYTVTRPDQHIKVTLDMAPLKPLPQDMGEAVNYDTMAPAVVTKGFTHQATSSPTIPSSGAKAGTPRRVS